MTSDERVRVALAGLGAVGTVVASRVNAWEGAELAVVAGGARREGLLREPPTLNGVSLGLRAEQVRAVPGDEWGGGANLALLAVKTGALEGAAAALRGWLRPDGGTIVLPLLNGIGATTVLREALGGRAAVLRGFVLCNSAVRQGHAVTQEGTFRVRLAGPPDWAAERALAVLRGAGIDTDIPADMESAQWEKWLLNVGLNQTEALLGLTHGELAANPDATAFLWTLVQEGVALAKAVGVQGADEMPRHIRESMRMLAPDGKSSMLQDVEAGRPTEVEAFAGTLCRMARARGLATPANDLAWTQLAR